MNNSPPRQPVFVLDEITYQKNKSITFSLFSSENSLWLRRLSVAIEVSPSNHEVTVSGNFKGKHHINHIYKSITHYTFPIPTQINLNPLSSHIQLQELRAISFFHDIFQNACLEFKIIKNLEFRSFKLKKWKYAAIAKKQKSWLTGWYTHPSVQTPCFLFSSNTLITVYVLYLEYFYQISYCCVKHWNNFQIFLITTLEVAMVLHREISSHFGENRPFRVKYVVIHIN